MRRDPLPVVLLLALALAAGIAWLTRYPESPVLDRLAGWPIVGPAAERFRELYRPTPPPPPAAPEVEVVIVGREPEPASPPPPAATSVAAGEPILPRRVWVQPGTELRVAPDPESAIGEVVVSLTLMLPRDRRGEWYRVTRVVSGGRSLDGWVRTAELREPTPEELRAPAPVLPLAADPPAPELLARARDLMGAAARETACGPYRLLSDAEDRELVARGAGLAAELDAIYARRFGLEPAGGPAEAILAFSSRAAYRRFAAGIAPGERRDAFAAPAHGLVVMTVADQRPQQVQAALAHELAHLLNRRFLGPALPPWLDEGLAEELAMSRFAEDGRLLPGTLAGWEERYGELRLVGGGRHDLARLRRAVERGEAPRLRELVALDRPGFRQPARERVHYSLSAFWVRYLLVHGEPAAGEGFRAFLGSVASGEPLTDDLLLVSLGSGWRELEEGFRGWLSATGGGSSGPA